MEIMHAWDSDQCKIRVHLWRSDAHRNRDNLRDTSIESEDDEEIHVSSFRTCARSWRWWRSINHGGSGIGMPMLPWRRCSWRSSMTRTLTLTRSSLNSLSRCMWWCSTETETLYVSFPFLSPPPKSLERPSLFFLAWSLYSRNRKDSLLAPRKTASPDAWQLENVTGMLPCTAYGDLPHVQELWF